MFAVMLTITPYGAAGEVTGSAYLVETDAASILVDFGMFQGDKDDDARNVIPGRIHRNGIDAVVLTHAHLDHCGRLPLLRREGIKCPIFATDASRDMAELVLRDAARIQEGDFERRKRRAERLGHKLPRTEQPMFDEEDVERTLAQFHVVDYDLPIDVAKGIKAVWHEAGHMLGSASVELRISIDGNEKVVVFSGDVGPAKLPYLRDPEPPRHADVVILESTYGDRDHKTEQETIDEFCAIVNDAHAKNGKIFVPAFAIGRTQQILYYYTKLQLAGRIPVMPVFVDSPMAIGASKIYAAHPELLDEESSRMAEVGNSPLRRRNVEFLETAEESKELNERNGPFMVIAGAGMCNAGRIVHHIRNNIENPNAHFMIVGFQAHGSLGRKIVDRVPEIRVMGEMRTVRAQIHTLGGMSAHAGQSDLTAWFGAMAASKPTVILTHGEDSARKPFADRLRGEFGVEPILPVYAQHLSL